MAKVVCKQCGEEFKASPSANRKFCSHRCYAQWQSENIRGESHPRWLERDIQDCEVCGKELSRRQKRFCSQSCRVSTGHLQFCEQCGIKFRVPPWRAKRGEVRFCSLACYNQHRKKQEILHGCEWCEKEFVISLTKVQSGGGRFCSQACKNQWLAESLRGENCHLWKGGLITAICLQCGEEFATRFSRIARGQGKFCSRGCCGRWQSQNRVGEQAANWHGGISFDPYGIEFDDVLRKAIRERDGHRCAICKLLGKGKALSIHHIDYRKTNNDPSNLVALCRNCHAITNGNREYWQRTLSRLSLLHEQFPSALQGLTV